MLDDILRTLKSPASEHLPARIKAASRLASDKSLVYPNKLDFVLNWTLLLLAKFQNPFASNADPDSSERYLYSYFYSYSYSFSSFYYFSPLLLFLPLLLSTPSQPPVTHTPIN